MSLVSLAGAHCDATGPATPPDSGERPVHAITILAGRSLTQQQIVLSEKESLLAVAHEHCNHQRWEQLNATCDALIAKGWQSEWVIVAKARACHDLGRWGDYLILCRSLMLSHPGNCEYLQGTIRGCMNTHNYTEAIQHLTHLIAQGNHLQRWAVDKRREACILQAEADARALSGLPPTAHQSAEPVVLPPSPIQRP